MTREELWINGIACALSGDAPSEPVPDAPAWHYEQMLAAIYDAATGADPARAFPERSWRLDEFLYAVYCAVAGLPAVTPPSATSRVEQFWLDILDALTGGDGTTTLTPAWRSEKFLETVCEAAESGREKTLAGALVSFTGKPNTRITALSVAVAPKQSGSGVPAPGNERTISGWTGANIYVSPTVNVADATTYNEDWTSEAGTVYGCTLDVLAGELTVDRVLFSTTWSAGGSATTYGECTRKRFAFTDADDKSKKTDAICNVAQYIPTDTSSEWANGGVFSIHNSSKYLYLSLPTSTDGATAIQLCYYLATPVTYTLTAEEVSALVGQNNIWSDAGDVTVKVKGAAI